MEYIPVMILIIRRKHLFLGDLTQDAVTSQAQSEGRAKMLVPKGLGAEPWWQLGVKASKRGHDGVAPEDTWRNKPGIFQLRNTCTVIRIHNRGLNRGPGERLRGKGRHGVLCRLKAV